MARLKIIIFVQARINSTRLPKKILKKIDGKTILEIILERLKKIKQAEKIVLVTGESKDNSELIDMARKIDLEYFSGNEINLLDRFFQASQKFSSDIIIRITGDCPFIDYNLIEKGLKIFKEKNCDILTIGRKRTFPHGFDFEIFKTSGLKRAWKEIKNNFPKEFDFFNTFMPPTKHMLESENFQKYDLINDKDYSFIRITLDYPEDFELIKRVYKKLVPVNPYFGTSEIINLFKENPTFFDINRECGEKWKKYQENFK